MFNIGGGELLVILVVALIVLGPSKLPEAARQLGRVMSQFRRMSDDFQREMQQAIKDPVGTMGAAGGSAREDASDDDDEQDSVDPEPDEPTEPHAEDDDGADGSDNSDGSDAASPSADEVEPTDPDHPSGTDDPAVSTAERAGMYDVPATGNGTEAL